MDITSHKARDLHCTSVAAGYMKNEHFGDRKYVSIKYQLQDPMILYEQKHHSICYRNVSEILIF